MKKNNLILGALVLLGILILSANTGLCVEEIAQHVPAAASSQIPQQTPAAANAGLKPAIIKFIITMFGVAASSVVIWGGLTIYNKFFVMHKDGKQDKFFEMIKDFIDERFVYLSIKLKFSETGHFWYHFEVDTLTRHYVLGSGENLDLAPVDEESNYLQLVYEKDSKIDKSFHKGIIYHIFVDRFNKKGKVLARPGLKLVDSWEENVDKEFNEKKERVNVKCYGGNFEGIISKLDYLSSLNVKTLYLSPIFEANSSHKYDVADYQKIDSMFGGEKKFKELIDKAKEKGINIIIDGVFNHTGSDSVYFNKEGRYKNIGAYQSQKSKYYPWYEFYEYPDGYSAWWGVKTLPQTREDSSFFDFISGRSGIIEKYMSMGIMGFRLDVVDELSNKFLYAICSRARRVKNNCMMLGEVWEDASCKLSYGERKNYFLGWYLDSVTNYPMKNAILHFVKFGNEKEFVDTINMIERGAGNPRLCTIIAIAKALNVDLNTLLQL